MAKHVWLLTRVTAYKQTAARKVYKRLVHKRGWGPAHAKQAVVWAMERLQSGLPKNCRGHKVGAPPTPLRLRWLYSNIAYDDIQMAEAQAPWTLHKEWAAVYDRLVG